MQLPKVKGTAISIEEDENGELYYLGHIFLEDDRVIVLDAASTPELAQKEIETYTKFIEKVEAD